MKFDATYNRLENHKDALGKAWADELVYGIIEAEDWEGAVDLIADQMVEYDYGRTDLPAHYAGKIYLTCQDTNEIRVYGDDGTLLAYTEWQFNDAWDEHFRWTRKELGTTGSYDLQQYRKDRLKEVRA